ncbi:carboxymuconolactone decarboxylase family protein [Nocardia exalbida]|uniref:carboxymuconolactone decarboxylase family protein n=1 Tax=Nocardia exalbida TaxID=290231 RepID=UPI00030F6E18|nr:carboxymuconolactone decarboxylase family protein [Nocardia exalbida]
MTDGPRGDVFGPFVPLLRSPVAMTRLQHLGQYLRFESTLPRDLFEMAVLLTARARDQDFEWAYHAPLARTAGVPEPVIHAIAHDAEPENLETRAFTAHRLVAASLHTNEIDDETYDEAVACLGAEWVIDLVVTAGYYSTLAMVMNLARTPVLEDSSDLAIFRSPRTKASPQ